MASCYLDIETTGLDHEKCDIIALQYAYLDGWSGKLSGDIHILTEWDCGDEENMLEKFVSETDFMDRNVFGLIPVGYNLSFEERFIRAKMAKYGIDKRHGFEQVDIMTRPHIDMHAVGIMCNGGAFKGSGLDRMTAKPKSGAGIPELYANSDYAAIVEYIKNETHAFVDWYSWLLKRMPEMHREWKGETLERIPTA